MKYRHPFRILWAALALGAGGCGINSIPPQPNLAPPETMRDAPAAPATAPRARAAASPLDDYIARPEPAFKWEKTASDPITAPDAAPGAGHYDLKVTSQTWQGKPWTHHVEVIRPAKLDTPDTALIFVSFGSGSAPETLFGQIAANSIGATFVDVFDVPNQPLYGKYEDDLIAHTFDQYLTTGDATWPLLFPMTKSVVKAMDAIQQFSAREWKHPITKFVIAGASKRGWTTWLTGAADKRVIGIIPIVYDNLNLPVQMPHQLATWGQYSDQIKDYTRRGLQQKMTTPRGLTLAHMVDPYTYRDRITVPKLIINATNDPYWTLDSLNLYRKDLKGPVSVLYEPNVGHTLGGQEQRAFGTATAWFRLIAGGKSAPSVSIKASPAGNAGARRFELTTDSQPQNVQLWVAHAATKDFRPAHWDAVPMTKQGNAYIAEVPQAAADAPYSAAFGEVELEGNPVPLRLSSSMTIWPEK